MKRFTGEIGSVRIYNRILTGNEIIRLHFYATLDYLSIIRRLLFWLAVTWRWLVKG